MTIASIVVAKTTFTLLCNSDVVDSGRCLRVCSVPAVSARCAGSYMGVTMDSGVL